MKRRTVRLIALLSVSIWIALYPGLSTAGHASQVLGAPAPGPASGPTQDATIDFGGAFGSTYSPKDVFISPGESVRWQGDFASHPLVSDDGLWQTVNSGTVFTFTFNQAGTYAYHCSFHGSIGMNGTVTVGYRVLLPEISN